MSMPDATNYSIHLILTCELSSSLALLRYSKVNELGITSVPTEDDSLTANIF